MQTDYNRPMQSGVPNSWQTRNFLFTCLIVEKKRRKNSELGRVHGFFCLQVIFDVTQLCVVVEPFWREKHLWTASDSG